MAADGMHFAKEPRLDSTRHKAVHKCGTIIKAVRGNQTVNPSVNQSVNQSISEAGRQAGRQAVRILSYFIVSYRILSYRIVSWARFASPSLLGLS